MTTDLIPSISIKNLVNQRAALLQRLGQAFDLITEAAEIAAEAKLGMPDLTIGAGYGYRNTGRRIAPARLGTDKAGARYEREAADRAELDKLARLGVDGAAWQYLILGALGMLICGAWVYRGAQTTSAINIAFSLKREERPDSGVELPDSLDKLLIS